jgi:hypothetical protein
LGQNSQLVDLLMLADVAVDACLLGNNGKERKVEKVTQRHFGPGRRALSASPLAPLVVGVLSVLN